LWAFFGFLVIAPPKPLPNIPSKVFTAIILNPPTDFYKNLILVTFPFFILTFLTGLRNIGLGGVGEV
jgi:hypothetical protein